MILLFGSFKTERKIPLCRRKFEKCQPTFSLSATANPVTPTRLFCRIGALVFREPLKFGNLAEKTVFNGKITPCARLNNSVIRTLAKPDFSSLNPRFSSQANFWRFPLLCEPLPVFLCPWLRFTGGSRQSPASVGTVSLSVHLTAPGRSRPCRSPCRTGPTFIGVYIPTTVFSCLLLFCPQKRSKCRK